MVNSALIGQPPLTDSDYWILKGNRLLSGKSNLDPSKGLKILPLRPPPDQYRFETRGPVITAVSAVIFVIMVSVTVARFMLRKFMKELKFGLDDWLMVPALVSDRPFFCGSTRSWADSPDIGIAMAYPSNLRCQVFRDREACLRCHVPRVIHEQTGLLTMQGLIGSSY